MTAIVTVDDQALDGVVQVRDLVDVAPEKGLEVGDPQRPVVVDDRIVHQLDEVAETPLVQAGDVVLVPLPGPVAVRVHAGRVLGHLVVGRGAEPQLQRDGGARRSRVVAAAPREFRRSVTDHPLRRAGSSR